MAEHENTPAEGAAAAKSGGGMMLWLGVGAAAAVIGALAPYGVALMANAGGGHGDEHHEESHGGGGHGGGHGSSHGGGHGKPTLLSKASSGNMVFLPFEEVTVNLDEGRLTRYLRIKMALHVRKSDADATTAALNEKKLILRNWMLSHLSDKELDDIRGKAGQNMLRREIRDHINATLFKDNYERVYDVLFEEFNVQ